MFAARPPVIDGAGLTTLEMRPLKKSSSVSEVSPLVESEAPSEDPANGNRGEPAGGVRENDEPLSPKEKPVAADEFTESIDPFLGGVNGGTSYGTFQNSC